MRFLNTRSIALLMLACAPALAQAGMFKCVSPKGTIIFSDRPCDVQNGEKAAEIKDDAAFAALVARDNAQSVARACVALERRVAQCRIDLTPLLVSNLHEHCKPPVRRFQQSLRAGRDESEDDSYRYRELSPQEARCDALPAETWAFVKANFGQKMSEEDIRAIEYKLVAVPSDGYTPDLSKRRRRYP